MFDVEKIFQIAFIVLISGIMNEIGEFATASDKLSQKELNWITNFYEMKESLKLQKPSIRFYEDFLKRPYPTDAQKKGMYLNVISPSLSV